MKKSTLVSNSPRATRALGSKVAKSILKLPVGKHAVVVSLEGDLGSGKTTFSQGFARGLGVKERVSSPTFVIMKPYKLKTKNYKLFYHIDCYRLKSPKELLELHWKDIVKNPRAIALVEWGNRVQHLLPRDAFHIRFKHAI
ncbi:MAG: tRNA (adenosine(37)-N6)-threonylcarbamoyltransferase complex ATPase subunit type 1 TsaE [Candidatus Wildermuthbacteria bacterium RIFCSPHIGHO2_01_FULL_48_25]|uniref:tRNA threonylcarbamoyladenosine biosynthesis protein TsaE n=1 Tax=Candidatus Wildermuthbacteria bacterium RIFCSPLOWO2_01_FULL_48_16 TaxID=1802461 RepID=A0A1G2RM34_9BACT|nr:MAG: tRNA (adenosine(37)-N6)-threonylcarbamoyltransferase complex ATPase subunit type 1 TsaE [Candidatus Wildermuthbacteria bacterium RIFCSPHIGHO2_01_FULL_48_25]OHA68263.1 MAG: tRNA (adenosine(37)-N6)-threonylcarbamoyltransferase complex ATPase subunit type 1 TsaE [Candidatus Wildermuthbacteria bacterium RIFCSPHIGHO2_02_FULL_49_12b]OHA73071.1 MAG: tRNA (adenosine(37)-N6)-threonylcarbamoyltransferase complex ATPase subunit type 1 TsaE [Candidatus Wildermuthbacteria bacterium RIFCSPLOWO2_01_FULL